MKSYNIYNENCLKELKNIPNKTIDLILIDPPYNINIAKWDDFKNNDIYIEFMGKVFKELERVLKNNGSFYFFHNEMLQLVHLQNFISENTSFIFNSVIHWIKPNFRPLSWKNPSKKSVLRSWFNCVEYCMFYTMQSSNKLQQLKKENENPFSIELKRARLEKKVSINEVAEYGHFYGKINHGGAVSNWEQGSSIPNKQQWEQLCSKLPITKIDYDKLKNDYDKLKNDYDKFRYTHNLANNHNNIWESKITNNGKLHPTQKPLDILERIIKTSSNENDLILDCFMGVGSTGIACLNTNRKFIGIEKDKKYFELAKNRIENHKIQQSLF